MSWQQLFIDSMNGVDLNDTAAEKKKVAELMRSLIKEYPKASAEERKSIAIAILKKKGAISRKYGND